MEDLAEFLEPIRIQDHDDPIGEAYKMDGCAPAPSMRKRAGLGTLHCCDYVRIDGEKTILIEDTQLGKTMVRLQEKYDSMEKEKREEYIRERIKSENCLKVYGSLLVLCRLDKWSEHREFILVSSDGSEAIFLQNRNPNNELQAAIREELCGEQSSVRGALQGGGSVKDVRVISVDKLRDILRGN